MSNHEQEMKGIHEHLKATLPEGAIPMVLRVFSGKRKCWENVVLVATANAANTLREVADCWGVTPAEAWGRLADERPEPFPHSFVAVWERLGKGDPHAK